MYFQVVGLKKRFYHVGLDCQSLSQQEGQSTSTAVSRKGSQLVQQSAGRAVN